MGAIFIGDSKPYEVELLIAQVDGGETDLDLFHILYDGSIVDEHGVVAIGGESEQLTEILRQGFTEGMDLGDAVRLGRDALGQITERDIPAADLEVSGLDRTRPRRRFFRLDESDVADLLG